MGGYLSRGHSPEDTSSLADSDPEVHRGLPHFYPPPFPAPAKVQQALTDEESQAEELACLLNLKRFAFVWRGRSWVPSPLAGEGQGEGKSGGNESTHPNEKCCKKAGLRWAGGRGYAEAAGPGVASNISVG